MKRINKYFFAIIVMVFCHCGSEKKEDPYQPCTEFDKVNAELLKTIDQIENKFRDNKDFIKAFKMEQIYWIQYRDRRLRAVYPGDWSRKYRKTYGEDVFNPCKCKEMLRLEKSRLEDLIMYLKEGPANQSDCPSMLNK